MPQPPGSRLQDAEIELIDILRFLNATYKTIVIFGFSGIALSIAYLAITPKRFEASVQISMAKIGAANYKIDRQGVNIEEPVFLIGRMSSPTSFTPRVIAACGLRDQANTSELLSNSIKLMPAKGVPSVIELKTYGPSPQAAQECSLHVFELIKATQYQMVEPYIEEAKVRLADNEGRLQKAKELLAKAEKSELAMTASYLSTRDEIRYLLDEIISLKHLVTSSQNLATRMVAPIYVSDVPIAPKKRIVLAQGLFGGLFLGLLIALVHQMVQKLKGAAGGVL